jgi:hypothetical protein
MKLTQFPQTIKAFIRTSEQNSDTVYLGSSLNKQLTEDNVAEPKSFCPSFHRRAIFKWSGFDASQGPQSGEFEYHIQDSNF